MNRYVLVAIPVTTYCYNEETAEQYVSNGTKSHLCWDVTDRVSVVDGRTLLDGEDVSS